MKKTERFFWDYDEWMFMIGCSAGGLLCGEDYNYYGDGSGLMTCVINRFPPRLY